MDNAVAADGSSVAVYLALPSGDTPALIHNATRNRGSILELGSGPGRITRPLSELGHPVVAVDNSEAMLAHIGFTEVVLGDLFDLDLERAFDAVVAGSYLINTRDTDRRHALLQVCRRHVAPDGVVLIERFEPHWAADPKPTQRQLGPVHITFEPLAVGPGWFRGRAVYTIDDRTWTHEVNAASVTDEMLAREAEASDLRLTAWLNETKTWAKLTAAYP